jgi:hypothetical protein
MDRYGAEAVVPNSALVQVIVLGATSRPRLAVLLPATIEDR